MTVTARRPAVAGQFYPADPVILADTVDGLLDSAPAAPDGLLARAYVVPHAGYRYSGLTASCVYAHLRAHTTEVLRVVLIGPAHYVPLSGCAVSSAAQWHTPLGPIHLDTLGRDALVRGGLAAVDDEAHAPEHSLEVQVPFLQRALGSTVRLLPVAVGRASPARVAAALTAMADEPATVVICSTDLSHYLDEESARAQDGRTLRAAVDLRPDGIDASDACGSYALRGLLHWAARIGMRGSVLHQSTSADAGPGRSRVVGYGALSFR